MANPTCPSNCGTPLPVHSFSNCAPEIFSSEIEWLLYTKSTAPGLTDVTSAVEWASRVSNTSTSDNAIRQLRVTGDMPAPQDQEITISGQRRYVVNRTHSVNADVDEANDLNHQAFRQLQCGGSFRFWFVTKSGHLFGGKDGEIVSLKPNLVLGRGEQEIQKYLLAATWNNKFMPERHLWALAGTTTAGSVISFRYGNIDAGVPVLADINAATAASGTQGQDILVPADGFGNEDAKICFMAEPSSEPAKTVWYNSPVNTGPIGVGETFLVTVVGDWRVYYTALVTLFEGSVEFRVD